MKKILLSAIAAISVIACAAQENQLNRLPEIGSANEVKDYSQSNTGFWIAAEASGAYSCRLFHSNFSLAEVDAVFGYRFNDYLRVGLGVGARYYFDNDKVRYTRSEWAFPLYFNMRGNFMPAFYRNLVPYWSVDVGGTIRDGLLVRPTLGLRIGRQRSAFLLGLGYMGQDMKTFALDDKGRWYGKSKFVSFVTLKLGYEF
ncbi:MAG: hypothetical protein PUA76_05735 [Bacteroidales bacterium]|nr:hypothetical protein [Bacteroidales bacterium]